MINIDYHETGKIFVRINGEIVRKFSSLAEAEEYLEILQRYKQFETELGETSCPAECHAYKKGFKNFLKYLVPRLYSLSGVDILGLTFEKWLMFCLLSGIKGASEITKQVSKKFGLYGLNDAEMKRFSALQKPQNLPKVKAEFDEKYRTLKYLIQLYKDAENVAASRVEQIQKEERELKKIKLQLLSRTETARKALIEKKKLEDENYNHKHDWEFEADLEEFMESPEFIEMIESQKV
jgi:hypothetical protein